MCILGCSMLRFIELFFFFFQAEDGIRDLTVTGVQTCALPIYPPAARTVLEPGETLQRLVIAQRVDLAGEQVPAAPDRPGAGRLDLLESGLDRVEQWYRALVAVGEVHHRVVGGLVLQVHLRTLAALDLGIPLYGGIRAPVDRKSTRLNSSHSQISYAGF